MMSFTPKTLSELHASLAQLTPQSKIISGGTDLIINMNSGEITPDALLYMGNVPELKKIEQVGDTVEIGAAVTMTELENSPILQGKLQAIVDGAKDVGSQQIRNNGTIGGNIGTASPAGDFIPILFMLDAVIVIANSEGTFKELPIKEVILGPGKTCIDYNEAIVKIKIKIPESPNYKSAFVKLGSRSKVTISRIGVTMGLEIEDHKITKAKVVIGAITPTPVNFEKAEKAMIGRVIDKDLKDEIGQMLSDLIKEISKSRSREYKAWAAKGVIEDVLDKFVA
ncbi:FAD binding domain-containing protein [Natranaerobius thermophilus]|uniref:Molybdopterin dehydrogenase FAD-binding n=1 Tax=Natranaerobius thermophilus (strain ATCC BAA-1301 / DSM 18059 / JW/NM-WN-LF) TaxID=457570 RepID=B2A7Q2_NATTJ|nr:FAD binding domain-containing protein [Natranaerobius thermophilus]ACB84354.1 molybdopterin dehydrogenase FAD-binding [Natranaerobius thermophilus JW/NM-WN-LF]